MEKKASKMITRKMALDHRPGGQPADAFGAARDPQALEAADQGDQEGEDRRLDHADQEGADSVTALLSWRRELRDR